MKKSSVFVFIASLYLLAAFFVFRARAENIVPDGVEHVDGYNVVMNINSDASIGVTETIVYNYGNSSKPGFTRYIPLNYKDLNGNKFSIKITNVSVTDGNSAPYDFNANQIQMDKKSNYEAIAIGNDQSPVNGQKTYIINYVLTGAIKTVSGKDELFWSITGDQWPIYVGHPEVKVNFPQRLDDSQVSKECYIGLHEATIECVDQMETRSGDADYVYKGVVSYENMTIDMTFPKEIAQKPINQNNMVGPVSTSSRTRILLLIALAFLVALAVIVFVYGDKIKILIRHFHWKKQLRIAFVYLRKIFSRLKYFLVKFTAGRSRKWQIGAGIFLVIIIIGAGLIFLKIQGVLNKVSTKGENVASIVHASIGDQGGIKGESDDRINILLLGILGANHLGGGLNTDTIMVASVEPKANRMSLISIPRDLWVTDPGRDTKSKINAVYEYGEERESGGGITDMEKMVGNVTGLTIDYTVVVSTQGFSQLVDTLGGVDVDLPVSFDEGKQFVDISVCDSDTYTIPTGQYDTKKNSRGKIVAQYPLCENGNPECGGNFTLPAGKNTLTGHQALCFIRSRYQTSDFERSKRQQMILGQIKQKVTDLGIVDFGKINSILDNLGNNVRTDMQLWEMRRLFDLYKGMDNPKIYQWVLEDTKEGLLYAPDQTKETGFILLPRGDNYDNIHNLFQNIFDKKPQSDINPSI